MVSRGIAILKVLSDSKDPPIGRKWNFLLEPVRTMKSFQNIPWSLKLRWVYRIDIVYKTNLLVNPLQIHSLNRYIAIIDIGKWYFLLGTRFNLRLYHVFMLYSSKRILCLIMLVTWPEFIAIFPRPTVISDFTNKVSVTLLEELIDFTHTFALLSPLLSYSTASIIFLAMLEVWRWRVP